MKGYSDGGEFRSRRWNHATSCHFPNLRPTASKVPMSSKPALRCSATLPSLGRVTPAYALQKPFYPNRPAGFNVGLELRRLLIGSASQCPLIALFSNREVPDC